MTTCGWAALVLSHSCCSKNAGLLTTIAVGLLPDVTARLPTSPFVYLPKVYGRLKAEILAAMASFMIDIGHAGCG